MSTKKISELTAATTIASEDLLPIVVNPTDNPTTRKATVDQLFSAVTIAASQVTSGEFDAARIPTLDAAKIATGTLDAARIPDLSATYQAVDVDLSAIAALTPTTGNLLIYGASAWEARTLTAADVPNLSAEKITSGTLSDAVIPGSIARDSEVTAGLATKQDVLGFIPLSPANNLSDLANAATARTNLGLGTAATSSTGDFATAAQGATADTALQPGAIGSTIQGYDADLAAIAALTTTSFGRSVLTQADAAAGRSLFGLGTAATAASTDFATAAQGATADTALQLGAIGSTIQGYDADLAAIAALSPSTGNLVIRGASAWEARNLAAADVPSLDAAKITTGQFNTARIPDLSGTYQPLDSDLSAIAALSTTSFGRSFLTQADAAAARLLSWGIDIQISGTKPTTRSNGSALVSGDRWLNTAERIWFFWNGTYWLSEQVYTAATTNANLSTTRNDALMPIPSDSNNLFLLNFSISGGFASPQNATDFWTVNLSRVGSGGIGTTVATITVNDLSVAAGTIGLSRWATINTHLDVSALGIQFLIANQVRNASAGAIGQPNVVLQYRLAKP